MPSTVKVRVAVSFVVAAALAGCTSAGRPVGGSTHSPSAHSSAAAASCDKDPWRAADVVVTRNVTVPPVPVIAAVRVAQHPECGYDRIVLDVRGAIPGYSVQYVQRVMADASGQVMTMPGARYLVITVRPAQAHTDAGVPTVGSGVHTTAFPAMASWAMAGDFEGVVRIALGLSGPTAIRTGELPGRIYIDVKE